MFSSAYCAAAHGHVAILELLLSAGGDPNDGGPLGLRPLHASVAHGRVASTRALLRAGADPNARTPRNATPLHLATGLAGQGVPPGLLVPVAEGPPRRKAGALVRELLAGGADQSLTVDGLTARELARANRHTAVLRALDGNGAGTIQRRVHVDG